MKKNTYQKNEKKKLSKINNSCFQLFSNKAFNKTNTLPKIEIIIIFIQTIFHSSLHHSPNFFFFFTIIYFCFAYLKLIESIRRSCVSSLPFSCSLSQNVFPWLKHHLHLHRTNRIISLVSIVVLLLERHFALPIILSVCNGFIKTFLHPN